MEAEKSIIGEIVEKYENYTRASFIRLLRKLKKSLENAVRLNHRRVLVISGDNPEISGILTARSLVEFSKVLKKLGTSTESNIEVLYVYHSDMPHARLRRGIVEELVKRKTKKVKIKFIDYSQSEDYLGTTFNSLVMDLNEDLRPNDLGRMIGVVKGGGLIILQTPSWNEWDKKLTLFQLSLATPQHPREEVRNIFKKWFKMKLKEHHGIFIYDADNFRTIKSCIDKRIEVLPASSHRSIVIPEKRVFPREVYLQALTQDQVNVIQLLERFVEKPKYGRKRILILIADRGRGKSCALGIGAAALINELLKVKNRVRILVTAPKLSNVQSLMDLALKTLEALKLNPKIIRRGRRIIEIKGERYSIEYWEPIKIPSLRGDIVIVDEAAGLHVPMLHAIRKVHNRILYSSTIHGYEGAGRGFSIRFLQLVKEDPKSDIIEYEMKEPIRYGLDDPIEKWQFDTLLLDAEPAELDSRDLDDIANNRLSYFVPNLERWFSKEGEEELRQFFGIYVLAHYRNEPDDLGMMADAPHHTIRALKTSSGKIVCSVQLAEEGPIPPDMVDALLMGERIPGNIIPDRILKHLRIREFAETRGWRIVRIATHPRVQGRGIGTLMLKYLISEASQRGYNWIGAGFGVNPPLLKFWVKNDFLPIHISPDRNPVSGEYTVIVLNPLDYLVAELMKIFVKEFKCKLLISLHEIYRDMEVDVAHMMLTIPTGTIKLFGKLYLSRIQWDRLRIYSLGPMTYEAVCDVMKLLSFYYFSNYEECRKKLMFSTREEEILIMKVLQGRPWDEVAQRLNEKQIKIMMSLKEIAKKFVNAYVGYNEKPGITIKK